MMSRDLTAVRRMAHGAMAALLTCLLGCACLAGPAWARVIPPVDDVLARQEGSPDASQEEGDTQGIVAAAVQEPSAPDPATVTTPQASVTAGSLPTGLDQSDAVYVSLTRLAGADASLDSSLVVVRGEAVGEPVRSSTEGFRWVVLQSGGAQPASLSVLMPDEQVELISNFGRYQVKGTVVAVTGVYRVADPNQAGAIDVTAYVTRVVEPGGAVPVRADQGKLWVALGLLGVSAILATVSYFLRRSSRI